MVWSPYCNKFSALATSWGGRNLVKSIKSGCCRCRILETREVKVVMGPIQDVNPCIVPAIVL